MFTLADLIANPMRLVPRVAYNSTANNLEKAEVLARVGMDQCHLHMYDSGERYLPQDACQNMLFGTDLGTHRH